jgi:hypothetical protein
MQIVPMHVIISRQTSKAPIRRLTVSRLRPLAADECSIMRTGAFAPQFPDPLPANPGRGADAFLCVQFARRIETKMFPLSCKRIKWRDE